ncbi:MAG: BrnA antitoxin family protein [Planctomycetota bacterium]
MSANVSGKKSGTDWKFLGRDSDEGIDFSEIPRLDAEFWKKAQVRMPQKKASINIRLDQDVLDWFRGMGHGYQTRMNAVLRSYVRVAKRAS